MVTLVKMINVIKVNYLMEYIKTLSVNCANIADEKTIFTQTLYTHHTLVTWPPSPPGHGLVFILSPSYSMHSGPCTCALASHQHSLPALTNTLSVFFRFRSLLVSGGMECENRILNSKRLNGVCECSVMFSVRSIWALDTRRCYDGTADTWNLLKLKTNSTDLRPARAEGFHNL